MGRIFWRFVSSIHEKRKLHGRMDGGICGVPVLLGWSWASHYMYNYIWGRHHDENNAI
jgi:hypothetical protein